MAPTIRGSIDHVSRGLSHVKFKVRYNALLLKEFTVADMVEATGLNPESIRTELQRLRRGGFLESRPLQGKHNKRGGRPSIYQLTDGLESRHALSESIEAFYPPEPPKDHPTSQHYVWASHVLDQLESLDEQSYNNPGQINSILEEVERDLEVAEITEGEYLASESAKAYFQYERARLSYHLGNWEEFENILEESRNTFAVADDEVMLRRVDEFRLWAESCRAVNNLCTKDTVDTMSVRAQCLVTAFETSNYEVDGLLVKYLLSIVRELSRDRINQATVDTPLSRYMTAIANDERVARKKRASPDFYDGLSKEILEDYDPTLLVAQGQWVPAAALVEQSAKPGRLSRASGA